MALSTEFVVALALVASLFSAVMNALMKNESEKYSALKTSFMVIFYALVFLLPYVAFRIHGSGLSFDSVSVVAAVLAGIFGTGKVWPGVRAFQEIDFSVAQPMQKLAPPFRRVWGIDFYRPGNFPFTASRCFSLCSRVLRSYD